MGTALVTLERTEAGPSALSRIDYRPLCYAHYWKIRARREVALPDRAEAQLMIAIAEADRGRLHERILAGNPDLRFEAAFPPVAG